MWSVQAQAAGAGGILPDLLGLGELAFEHGKRHFPRHVDGVLDPDDRRRNGLVPCLAPHTPAGTSETVGGCASRGGGRG